MPGPLMADFLKHEKSAASKTNDKTTAAKKVVPTDENIENDGKQIREELEKLQIKTIFSLVEDLEVDFDYKPRKKKLLFITNKQAREIDLTNIWLVLEAMDVKPEPQLVINLLPSCQGHFHPRMCAGAFWGGNKACRKNMLKYSLHGEKSPEDVNATDLNVLMFLQ